MSSLRPSLDRLFTIPLALLFAGEVVLFALQLADRIGRGVGLADRSFLDALDLAAVTLFWAVDADARASAGEQLLPGC